MMYCGISGSDHPLVRRLEWERESGPSFYASSFLTWPKETSPLTTRFASAYRYSVCNNPRDQNGVFLETTGLLKLQFVTQAASKSEIMFPRISFKAILHGRKLRVTKSQAHLACSANVLFILNKHIKIGLLCIGLCSASICARFIRTPSILHTYEA